MGGELRAQYLQAMGIDEWRVRSPSVATEGIHTESGSMSESSIAIGNAAPNFSATHNDWDTLQQHVANCTRCDLHRTRTQTVFGIGNRNADWLVIGEAPGAEEDKRGEPFVGRAGQLLDAMLAAIDLDRSRAYIANILKCRPPNNRDPQADEVACCEPYLQQQIALIQPRLILAVGRIAAQNLLKTDVPLARLRGRVHRYGERQTPVIVTYHPAYLLRMPGDKRKAWEDLQLAVRIYQGIDKAGAV